MILAEVIGAALVLSLATGGSLRAFSRERLRGETLLLLLLPTQLVWPHLASRLHVDCSMSIIVWLLMMGALAAALFANVDRRPILAVAALGIAANVLVIGLNQAMPVSMRAASEIGTSRATARAALAGDCLHEEMDDRTRLGLLADVIAVPGPSWHRGVISLGDVLLSLGLAGWVFQASRGRHQSPE